MSLTTRKMSSRHEQDLVAVLGGEKTRNSGAVWSDQSDGHQTGLDQYWRFAWDGKALGVTARLLTPGGYVKMGEVQVGDRLVGLNGQVTVTGVFPQGEKAMYRLTFSDGTSAESTLDHLWAVRQRTTAKVRRGGRVIRQRSVVVDRVLTTEEILSCPESWSRTWLPEHAAVEFVSTSDLPVDPYVLGALLGDGCLKGGCAVLTSADVEIVDRVASRLPQGMVVTKFADRGTCAQYRISGKDSVGRHFGAYLDEALVERVSGHLKRVPEAYLTASVEDRWSLLQGLLDTDGWVEKGAGRFLSTSMVLRDQVAWIARSLGLRVNTYERRSPGRPAYQASIGYHSNLFSLSRKTALLRPPARTFHRTLVSAEEVGAEEAQCITVDAADGVFLVEDFVPTHNSTLGESIGVSLKMLAKLREQARGLIPMLPLRWYLDTRLTMVSEDWAAVELDTLAQVVEDANRFRVIKAWCEQNTHHHGGFADAVAEVEMLVQGESP